jgi:hypothetical protein
VPRVEVGCIPQGLGVAKGFTEFLATEARVSPQIDNGTWSEASGDATSFRHHLITSSFEIQALSKPRNPGPETRNPKPEARGPRHV